MSFLESDAMIDVSVRCDRKLQRKVILKGDCILFPREGAKVQIRITEVSFSDDNGPCKVDSSSKYFQRKFDGKFEIGDADFYLDEDLEHCVKLMSRGEINLLHFEYRNASGKLGRRVVCKVELITSTNEEVISDWDWSRLYAQAEKYKKQGVELVALKRITDAFRRFSKAYKLVVSIEPYDPDIIPDENVSEVQNLKVKLLNNMAHCQLHFKEYTPALEICNTALEIDKNNLKALYRRGLAHIGLEEWEAAHDDLQLVIKAEPYNKDALAKMDIVKPKYRAIMDNYTNVIRKMFG